MQHKFNKTREPIIIIINNNIFVDGEKKMISWIFFSITFTYFCCIVGLIILSVWLLFLVFYEVPIKNRQTWMHADKPFSIDSLIESLLRIN